MFISVFGIVLSCYREGLDTRTARPRSGWAERSCVSPTNPFGFSLDVLYSEMSSISINELCFEPAKKSGVWSLECTVLVYGNGRIYDCYINTKPLYYLIEYNRLDPLIAVKNKNIHDDLIREKTILCY